MGWLSLLAVAAALAMDAFAVAIVAGFSPGPLTRRCVFRLSFHFGLFQALMPALGWTAGRVIYRYIAEVDHWVAFGLLALVGGRMIVGSMHGREQMRRPSDPTSGWDLVLLSVATSIDALAVGLSLAVIGSGILVPSLVIGAVAASLTALGMALGRRIGALWGKRVEVIGGLVLIAIGARILLDHLTG
ncbi:MAG: manganese efflux pump [Nitrososphaerales archaeon]|nr:manganese efflux pump [Nitrososphaerales archaeon]